MFHLTASFAGRAGLHITFVASAASVAVWAGTVALYGHFLGTTVGDFLKRKAHAGTYIPTSKGTGTALRPAESAKTAETTESGPTEDIPQQVVQTHALETAESAGTAGTTGSPVNSGKAELVVASPLVLVTEHGIGLGSFLELLFCRFLLLQ